MTTQPKPKVESKRVFAALIAGGVQADLERTKLLTAPAEVTDALARRLTGALKAGGATTLDACRMLEELRAPVFGEHAWQHLVAALSSVHGTEAQAAAQRLIPIFGELKDDNYQGRQRAAAKTASSKSLVLRLLSITKNRFGIMFFDVPLLIGIIVVLQDPDALITTGAVLLGLGTLVAVWDSYRRRCPKCGKFLAGMQQSVVQDAGGYGTNVFSWRCVFCQQFWKTNRLDD